VVTLGTDPAAANTTDPTRPRVVQREDFLTGFVGGEPGDPKDSQKSWGRPADVQQLPDGSLLISDDGAHTVYRMFYTGKPRQRVSAGGAAENRGGALGGHAGAGTCLVVVAALLMLVMNFV